jgi:hypothetical protein
VQLKKKKRKMCNLWVLDIDRMYNHHYYLIPEYFHYSEKKPRTVTTHSDSLCPSW